MEPTLDISAVMTSASLLISVSTSLARCFFSVSFFGSGFLVLILSIAVRIFCAASRSFFSLGSVPTGAADK